GPGGVTPQRHQKFTPGWQGHLTGIRVRGVDRNVHFGEHALSPKLAKSWAAVPARRLVFPDIRTVPERLRHRCCNTLTTRPAAVESDGQVWVEVDRDRLAI